MLYSQGKVFCIVKGRFAVESRVRDTHFKQCLMGLEAWTSEKEGLLYSQAKVCCISKGRFAVETLIFNNSLWHWKIGLQREGLLYMHGKVCCIAKGRFAVESRLRDTHFV